MATEREKEYRRAIRAVVQERRDVVDRMAEAPAGEVMALVARRDELTRAYNQLAKDAEHVLRDLPEEARTEFFETMFAWAWVRGEIDLD
jgi:hypothetical protein